MILITGGTGSFGHAYLRHTSERVRVLSRDEEKQRAMARRYPEVEYVIGDVRDRDSVYRAARGCNAIFHAAALKQVPSCEFFPVEAVRTNVLGTEHVCTVARDLGIRAVVLSTDKAVEPVGVMGASKLLAEAVARSWGVNCVRYGNVVGSRGSLIPLIREQVRRGEPITITDPTMTRFLITLAEAVELVDTALGAVPDGSVYVRKSPAATVAQVVRVMAPGHPTTIIGIRPGEKRHEHLVVAAEAAVDHGDHFRVGPAHGHGGITYSSEMAPHLTDEGLAVLLDQAPDDDL